MKEAVAPIIRFIRKEINSGIVLVFVTIIAMIIANSPLAHFYFELFEDTTISIDFKFWSLSKPLYYWINDGLMAIFFFLIGLEVKREILIGELSSIKKAMFPFIGALGGMLIPALVFISFNINNEIYLHGWAIPMATDIAFALGIIALLKSRVPVELKIFLTSLAIVDDIGAVLTIAIFYTSEINTTYLLIALASWAVLFGLNKFGFRIMWVYILIGVFFVWYPLLKSGIHATIAGVLVAFTIPLRRAVDANFFVRETKEALDKFWENSEKDHSYKLNSKQYSSIEAIKDNCEKVVSPIQDLEHGLYNVTLYVIMPLFAFANTGIRFQNFELTFLTSNNLSLGIFFGLFIGKVIGITSFVFIFHKLKIIVIPKNLNIKHIIGAGFLGGIGFTMSIFISDLAFHGDNLIVISKISILIASTISGFAGYWLLKKA